MTLGLANEVLSIKGVIYIGDSKVRYILTAYSSVNIFMPETNTQKILPTGQLV